MQPRLTSDAPPLPMITIRRLRPASLGVRGPLVAVTVPGSGSTSFGKLLRIVAETVEHLKDTSPVLKLENIFFDFTSGTSGEMVFTGPLSIDETADAAMAAVKQAAQREVRVMLPNHPTGVVTHSIRVIQ